MGESQGFLGINMVFLVWSNILHTIGRILESLLGNESTNIFFKFIYFIRIGLFLAKVSYPIQDPKLLTMFFSAAERTFSMVNIFLSYIMDCSITYLMKVLTYIL